MIVVGNGAPELTMGQKLRMFRTLNNLSVKELADKLNVGEDIISAWESDEMEISLSNAKVICELFDIPNSYFVFNENFQSINISVKNKINEYAKDLEVRNKIDKIVKNCKKKLLDNGIEVKGEYLPEFCFEDNTFSSFGLFDEGTLPIRIEKREKGGEFGGFRDVVTGFDDNNIDNADKYNFNCEKLATFGLFNILNEFNLDRVELKDLISCDNLDIIKATLQKMKEKSYTRKNMFRPFEKTIDISSEYIQEQLNYLLENLNPAISKFWEIIVFLIDNGAHYLKQNGYGSEVTEFDEVEDVSKTNLVYRIAKERVLYE